MTTTRDQAEICVTLTLRARRIPDHQMARLAVGREPRDTDPILPLEPYPEGHVKDCACVVCENMRGFAKHAAIRMVQKLADLERGEFVAAVSDAIFELAEVLRKGDPGGIRSGDPKGPVGEGV